MFLAQSDTYCSHCLSIIYKGSNALEGMGGAVYCSPDCFAKGEEDEEYDEDLDPDMEEE